VGGKLLRRRNLLKTFGGKKRCGKLTFTTHLFGGHLRSDASGLKVQRHNAQKEGVCGWPGSFSWAFSCWFLLVFSGVSLRYGYVIMYNITTQTRTTTYTHIHTEKVGARGCAKDPTTHACVCVRVFVCVRLCVCARERKRRGEGGGERVCESVSLRVCVFVCCFSLLFS